MRSLLVPVILLLPALCAAKTIVVHSGESIQAAIDAAPPATTIRVEPGTYHEAGATRALTVAKDRIRLVAAEPGKVILEKTGTQEHGIWVSPPDTVDLADEQEELPTCGVTHTTVRGFALTGFTVRGFPGFGVYLACADGFRLAGNTATGNDTYALFPVRSRRGRVTRNVTSGTKTDACVYIGQSTDVVVDRNRATDCQIGLQMEDCQHVRMTHNEANGNTAGAIVDVLEGRQVKVAADNQFTNNVIHDNNRPNSASRGDETFDIEPGIGLVIDGADRTVVGHNRITGHILAGMTLLDYCVGRTGCPGSGLDINRYPDGNRVFGNRFSGNFVDVIFGPGSGTGNCFAKNGKGDLTALGGPLPPCGRPLVE